MQVIRWHRTAYETDASLGLEREWGEALGSAWTSWESRDEVPPGLDDADMLIVTSKVQVTEAVLARMTGGCVLTTTSGYDHIDVAAARRHGVLVGRCPMARRDAVVDVSVGSMLWLMRCLPELTSASDRGRWARADLPALAVRGLSGARVAVVGLGVIGQRMTKVLRAHGAEVLGVDPLVSGSQSLDEVLPRADAITLHCSLSPSSRGLLDAERISRLPSHAVIVNTARGSSLDVEAAMDAVLGGRLRGLAVDVFPEEPYPNLGKRPHPRVLLTPHSAGYTHDLGERVASEVVAGVRAWQETRTLPHIVGA